MAPSMLNQVRDQKERELEKIKPESKATKAVREWGPTVAGIGVGTAVGRAAKARGMPPGAPLGAGVVSGAMTAALGSLVGAGHAIATKDRVDARNLLDARERRDKSLARAGYTEDQAKQVPPGSATERSTRARNALGGAAVGAAIAGGLMYRKGRQIASRLSHAAHSARNVIHEGVKSKSVSPRQAGILKSRANELRGASSRLSGAGVGGASVVGGVGGLLVGDAAGKARQTKRQDARDAVNLYRLQRDAIVDLRKKEAAGVGRVDRGARAVRKHWRKVRDVMTSGPAGGAAVGAVAGAAPAMATADEGKGWRDAAIAGTAGAVAGGLIGRKYKKQPTSYGKGVRVVSDAEVEAMSAKGFLQPRMPRDRRLPG